MLSTYKVKELRELAKKRGIKPIPTRKQDLIDALEGKQKKNAKPTMNDLRTLCKKHKLELDIKCGGKGVTYEYLLNTLTKAGLLQLVTTVTSEYEQQLLDLAPKLHKVIAPLAPHIETLAPLFSSTLAKGRAQKVRQDAWKILFGEYSQLEHRKAAPSTKAITKKILNFLKGKDGAQKPTKSALQSFANALPLISYGYALQNPAMHSAVTEMNLSKLEKMSKLLKGTEVELPGYEDVELEDMGEEAADMLSQLPAELRYEIYRRLPVSATKQALLASRSLGEAAEHHRGLHERYGEYIMSPAQTLALKWLDELYDKRSAFKIKAPPSWGKTALAAVVAMKEVDRGHTVVIYTKAAMIPFFLDEMHKVFEKRFPDMGNPAQSQQGKIRIIAPGYSKKHADAYKKTVPADILLLTNKEGAGVRVRWPNDPNVLAKPISKYQYEFMIVDEAHKGDSAGDLVFAGLAQNPTLKALLLSANDIKFPSKATLQNQAYRRMQIGSTVVNLPGYKNWKDTASLSFSALSLKNKVPEVAVQLVHLPTRENHFDVQTQYDFGRELEFALGLDAINQIQPEPIGNTLVFSSRKASAPSRQTIEQLSAATDDDLVELHELLTEGPRGKNIVVYTGPKSIKKFQEQSEKKPTVFLLTYGSSAEGINLDTVDNVILLDVMEVRRESVYQAIARARRVKNPRHSVRVVADVRFDEKPYYMAMGARFVSEEFLEKLKAVTGTKNSVDVSKNAYKSAIPDQVRAAERFLSESRPLRASELYLLMAPLKRLSKPKKAALVELLREEDMFPSEKASDYRSLLRYLAREPDTYPYKELPLDHFKEVIV